MDDGTLDGDNVWRDGFVSSFTMILLAEIADKTFFIAAILGLVPTILVTDSKASIQLFRKDTKLMGCFELILLWWYSYPIK